MGGVAFVGEGGILSIDYYKTEDIDKITDKFRELEKKHRALKLSTVKHKFATSKGDEFAKHGYLRRCDTLWRCVQKTFQKIPPDLDGKPGKNDTKDVTIFLNAFMINVFGACDNLAWVLVYEKKITKSDGSELPPAWVGFRKDNTLIREKLSKEMIAVLDGFGDWFKHIDNFRHSLAHRIPLYVPPFMIRHDSEDDYNRLEGERLDALKRCELDEHTRLKSEQDDLTFFRPFFTHSFSEKSPSMVMHPQMLVDFATVLELGEVTLEELSRADAGETLQ